MTIAREREREREGGERGGRDKMEKGTGGTTVEQRYRRGSN